MLNCVIETLLKEVKLSGMYSLILNSTTDVSKLYQFAFVLKYYPYRKFVKLIYIPPKLNNSVQER